MPKLFSFIDQNRLKWLLLVCFLGTGFDQVSKVWAQQNLAEPYLAAQEIIVDGKIELIKKQIFYPTRIIEIVPHAVNLIYKENPAAAFSLTSSLPDWIRKPLLATVSILATMFFLIWYFRIKNDVLLLSAFSFILAGAIGNLSDRLRLGYVIDFLDVHADFLGYPYLHWPTFNIADSLIVLGAIGVLLRTLLPSTNTKKSLSLANTLEE